MVLICTKGWHQNNQNVFFAYTLPLGDDTTKDLYSILDTTDEVIVDDVTIVRMTNVVQLYIYKFYKTIGSNYLS